MKTPEGSSFSKASRFASERGKPSIRNGPRERAIAACKSPTVVSDATIFPSAIISAMARPFAEPNATSARSRSPAERWVA
eukprot:scaffold10546_cov114-Isochrysis_galbana.AAC.2